MGTEVTEPTGTVVSADGTPIAYWRSGEGPPLVLVHGTTSDHTRWAPMLPLLEEHATVYAIDRRGRGASGDLPDYDLDREFEDVAAVVDAIDGPVDVFGHSYGALCALEGSRLTSNLRRLVLYEPPVLSHVDPPLLDRLRKMLDAGEAELVLETFYREMVRMSAEEVALLRSLPSWQPRIAAAHAVVREQSTSYRFTAERFGSVMAPTLLLVGEESAPSLRASTDAVATALPRSRVAMLAGQQHTAVDTAPQLLASHVITFLRASYG